MFQEREINLGLRQEVGKLKETPVAHPKTAETIRVGIETGVFQTIDEEKRKLITVYYFTPGITLIDLTGLVSPRTKKGVKEVLLSSVEQIWSGLPKKIRKQIPKEEAVRLKHQSYSKEHLEKMWRLRTPEARRKMSLNAKQRGFPPNFERRRLKAIRKKGRPDDVRTKISDALRKRWQDPEYSSRWRLAIRTSGMERSGRAVWESAVNEGLIEKILDRGLLSKEEVEILRRGFKRKKPSRLISRDLLKKFLSAAERERTRRKKSDALKERWKDPEYSTKTRQVLKILGMERSGRMLWEAAVNEGLIPKILEAGLLSKEEIERLIRGFSRKKPSSLISRDLLDKFSIAVARVA